MKFSGKLEIFGFNLFLVFGKGIRKDMVSEISFLQFGLWSKLFLSGLSTIFVNSIHQANFDIEKNPLKIFNISPHTESSKFVYKNHQKTNFSKE